MSRRRMAKCLALCALALAVCVGIAAALVISKNRQRAAEAAAAATGWFGTSMSARRILGLEQVPRVRLFAD